MTYSAHDDTEYATAGSEDGGIESRSLRLEHPIVFLDVQTTGLDVRTARIVELSTLRIEPDGTEEFKHQTFNPQSSISPAATDKHGISDEHVADAPTFSAFARGLAQYLDGCDLAGFGINRFGLKVLIQEFNIAGVPFDMGGITVLDIMQVYHRLEPRNFEAAYHRYVPDAEPIVENDGGQSKLRAIHDIVQGQIAYCPELPNTPAAIASWTAAENGLPPIDDAGKFAWSTNGEPLINFGKYRGHRLNDIYQQDAEYLRWIAGNESFTPEQRDIAGNASEGIMPLP